MTTGLADFLRYNLWANMQLLDACAQLTNDQLDATLEGTYGSVRETLVHLFRAEEGYARHFNLTSEASIPPLRDFSTFPGFDELKCRAERSGKELIAVAEQVDLDHILYLNDGTYEAPVIVLLLQVVNHGIDHRSQIATLLSRQGVTPPEMDGWAYNDEVVART